MLDVIRAVKFSGKACWKPIQSGIQLSTQTVLDLYCYLVTNGSYNFLMTGRLTQDCVDNLFTVLQAAVFGLLYLYMSCESVSRVSIWVFLTFEFKLFDSNGVYRDS